MRDELLNGKIFDKLLETRVVIEGWRRDYSQTRQHSSPGNATLIDYSEVSGGKWWGTLIYDLRTALVDDAITNRLSQMRRALYLRVA
jgi:hypothetical protein